VTENDVIGPGHVNETLPLTPSPSIVPDQPVTLRRLSRVRRQPVFWEGLFMFDSEAARADFIVAVAEYFDPEYFHQR
jgi:hypothetical protein